MNIQKVKFPNPHFYQLKISASLFLPMINHITSSAQVVDAAKEMNELLIYGATYGKYQQHFKSICATLLRRFKKMSWNDTPLL